MNVFFPLCVANISVSFNCGYIVGTYFKITLMELTNILRHLDFVRF